MDFSFLNFTRHNQLSILRSLKRSNFVSLYYNNLTHLIKLLAYKEGMLIISYSHLCISIKKNTYTNIKNQL